jgi:MFS family permease
MLAINAFISDITEPDNRAFRYGMLHLASSLGRPIAAPIGAYLLKTGGYVCVFCTSLVGIVIGAVFLLIRIQSFKWKPVKKDKVN